MMNNKLNVMILDGTTLIEKSISLKEICTYINGFIIRIPIGKGEQIFLLCVENGCTKGLASYSVWIKENKYEIFGNFAIVRLSENNQIVDLKLEDIAKVSAQLIVQKTKVSIEKIAS